MTAALVCLALFAADAPLRVGSAVVNIDPETTPVPVDGYFTARFESEVIDELCARALVVESADGGRAALCVVDSCGVGRETLDAAKRRAEAATGIAAGRMLVSCTHTHTAPAALAAFATPLAEDYLPQLERQIAEAITAADGRLRPAEVGHATARATEWAYCRRWLMRPGTATTIPFTGRSENLAQMNPGHRNADRVGQTGPVDLTVTVLAFRDPQTKRPLALLGNFNTHYAGSEKMSSDYFGVFCREVGGRIGAGGEFVALMSNGNSGDANCIDFSRPAPRDFDMHDVAGHVMDRAADAYRRIEWRAEAPLRVATRDLTVAARTPSADEAAAAEKAMAGWGGRLPQSMAEAYVYETALMADAPAERTLPLMAWRLGDFAAAAFPNEVYASTGLTLKARSPVATTCVVGWANGYFGYLPPPDQFALGGYTTWRARSSCLDEGAEPKVVAAVMGLLDEVAGDQ